MGTSSLAAYRRSVATFNDMASINSPNPWSLVSLPRLDWLSLFYGLSANLHVAQLMSLACSIVASLWLLRQFPRVRPPPNLLMTSMFLTPLLCLGSLAVYHHQYDLCLFFAPVLLVYFGPLQLRRPSWTVPLLMPLLVMIALLPIGAVQHAIQSIVGDRAVGVLKLAFPVAVTLAFFGSAGTLASNVTKEPTG
jgi:hypothetical protein